MENKFEVAARTKLRFVTRVGNISVEDVWDLPLESSRGFSLTELAEDLVQGLEVKDSTKLAFLKKKKPNKEQELAQLRFDIVEYIATTKVKEQEDSENAKEIAERKKVITDLINRKKAEETESKSIEELQEELKNLG